jgi:hypothetical protein
MMLRARVYSIDSVGAGIGVGFPACVLFEGGRTSVYFPNEISFPLRGWLTGVD